MRCNGVDLDCLRTNQAHACLLIPVNAAEPWAQITFAKMRVSLGALLCRVDGRYEMIAGDVVVEQPWRGEVEVAGRQW